MSVIRSPREIRLREELDSLQVMCDNLTHVKSSLFHEFQPETERELDDTNVLIVTLIKKAAAAHRVTGALLDQEITKREAW